MSDWSRWIVVVVVLAVVVPLGAVVLRRIVRGEPFDDGGGPLPPPSGPSISL